MFVGEPREVQTQLQRSICGTTKVLGEAALVSHARDPSSPFCYVFIFCHVGEDFASVVYSRDGLT